MSSTRAIALTVAAIAAALCVSVAVAEEIPSLVTFAGRLTDGTGWGKSTVVAMTVRVYGQAEGGAALWESAFAEVAISDGHFSLFLGDGADPQVPEAPAVPLKSVVLAKDALWLAVSVNGGEELLPRTEVTSVPYAFKAQEVVSNGIPPGMIAMFDDACPSGWQRVEELDGYSVRGGEQAGLPVGKSNDTASGKTATKTTGWAEDGGGQYTEEGAWGCRYCQSFKGVTFVNWYCPVPNEPGDKASCHSHRHTMSELNVTTTAVPKHRLAIFCRYVGNAP
jgi:hypothetical protein